jgi:hypothetical protein
MEAFMRHNGPLIRWIMMNMTLIILNADEDICKYLFSSMFLKIRYIRDMHINVDKKFTQHVRTSELNPKTGRKRSLILSQISHYTIDKAIMDHSHNFIM